MKYKHKIKPCRHCNDQQATSIEQLHGKSITLCDKCSDELKIQEQTRHDNMQHYCRAVTV